MEPGVITSRVEVQGEQVLGVDIYAVDEAGVRLRWALPSSLRRIPIRITIGSHRGTRV